MITSHYNILGGFYMKKTANLRKIAILLFAVVALFICVAVPAFADEPIEGISEDSVSARAGMVGISRKAVLPLVRALTRFR